LGRVGVGKRRKERGRGEKGMHVIKAPYIHTWKFVKKCIILCNYHMLIKNFKLLVTVAQTCNSSYLGGRDQKGHG
jgi:hypothetical protein